MASVDDTATWKASPLERERSPSPTRRDSMELTDDGTLLAGEGTDDCTNAVLMASDGRCHHVLA